MDDIEDNKVDVPEENENEDEDDNDSDTTLKDYGGNYLEKEEEMMEEDNYDWGDSAELEALEKKLEGRNSLIDKFNFMLKDIEKEKDLNKKENKIRGYKFLLRETVEQLNLNDKLNEEKWDEKLKLEEIEKFLWEQKINNVNKALKESGSGIKLDSSDKELYDYLKENLTETFTDGDKGENLSKNINGYEYGGKKIIQRRRGGNFTGNDSKNYENFVERMKLFTKNTARSEIIRLLDDDQNTEVAARDCIRELRDGEKEIISNLRNVEDFAEERGKIGEMEDTINNIKNNKEFNNRGGIVERTVQGFFSRTKAMIKGNEIVLGAGVTSVLLSIVTGLATSIPLLEKMKDARDYAIKVAGGIEKLGKNLKKTIKKLDSIFKNPLEATGTIIELSGIILKDLMNLLLPLIVISIIGIFLFYINKWTGVF